MRRIGLLWIVVVAPAAALVAAIVALLGPPSVRAPLALLSAALGAATLVGAVVAATAVGRASRTAVGIAGGTHRHVPERGWLPPELRALDQALGRLAGRLDERGGYASSFAASVTHELKNPLTAIRGAAELLIEQRARMSDEQYERFIRNIDEDAARMEMMVSRLLELARAGNPLPESIQKIDVREFFAAVGERYGDAIRVELDEPPAAIAINEVQLTAAVANVVDNAVRHGRGRLVEVGVGADGGRLRVTVRDRGSGINPRHQVRLFQPFFTTERDRGGTGLGLTIVKAVTDARGGRVELETSPAGTTVTLVL